MTAHAWGTGTCTAKQRRNTAAPPQRHALVNRLEHRRGGGTTPHLAIATGTRCPEPTACCHGAARRAAAPNTAAVARNCRSPVSRELPPGRLLLRAESPRGWHGSRQKFNGSCAALGQARATPERESVSAACVVSATGSLPLGLTCEAGVRACPLHTATRAYAGLLSGFLRV